MSRALAFGTLALGLGACQTPEQDVLPAASAPRTCAMVRGAYCIENAGYTIDVEPLPGETRLTVYEDWWRAHPLIIREPSGCRDTLSDTIELLSQADVGLETRFRVRFARNGRCDVLFIVGSEASDPADAALTALSAALSQIRTCRSRPCEGPVVATEVGSTFEDRVGRSFERAARAFERARKQSAPVGTGQ